MRRKNLIAGSICLGGSALLRAFRRCPATTPRCPATRCCSPAAAQQVQATHYITMPPGFSIRYESPRPFASVVAGNTNLAEAVPGATDRVLVITSKPAVEGQTNFLLVDRSGQEVGNVVVTVANPEPVRQGNKVVVHNKINNLPGYTAYICNPICFRVQDDLEGSDRVPERNLFSQSTTSSDTVNQTIKQTPAPAGTQ